MRGDKVRKVHNWQVWVVGSRGEHLSLPIVAYQFISITVCII